jgi:hypothetical protein
MNPLADQSSALPPQGMMQDRPNPLAGLAPPTLQPPLSLSPTDRSPRFAGCLATTLREAAAEVAAAE